MVRSWRQCCLQTAAAKQAKLSTKLWNKNCFDRLCFSAHSGLVYTEFRSEPGNSNSLSLTVSVLFLSYMCSLHVKTQVLYTLCLLLLLCTGRSQPMRASWRRGRGNTGASWKCTAQVQRLRKIKPWWVSQQVSLRSDEVHTMLLRSTSSCNKATQPCLSDNVICVIYTAVLDCFLHSFIWKHN